MYFRFLNLAAAVALRCVGTSRSETALEAAVAPSLGETALRVSETGPYPSTSAARFSFRTVLHTCRLLFTHETMLQR